MRKLLAFLCALTMVLSLGVVAFAETHVNQTGGEAYTQTITVNANAPIQWLMYVPPGDFEIEPFAEKTFIGDFSIDNRTSSDVHNYAIYGYIAGISPDGSYDLSPLTANGEHDLQKAALKYYVMYESISTMTGAKKVPYTHASGSPLIEIHGYGDSRNTLAKIYVEVPKSEWDKALPGTTYEHSVTFWSQAVMQ